MPKTPDPNYWGNPPQTPVSSKAQQPVQSTQSAQPVQPQATSQMPTGQTQSAATPQGQPTAQHPARQMNFDPQTGQPLAQQDQAGAPLQGEAQMQNGQTQAQGSTPAGSQPQPDAASQPGAATPLTSAVPTNATPQQQPANATYQQQGQPNAQQQPNAAAQPQQQPSGSAYPAPPANAPASGSTPNMGKDGGKRGLIVVIIVLVCLLSISCGVSSCNVLLNVVDNTQQSGGAFDYGTGNNSSSNSSNGNSYSSSEQATLNSSTRQALGLSGSSSFTENDLATVEASCFNNASIKPDANGNYGVGVYRVGTDLPAGTYWFSGSSSELSYFYILTPTSDGASTYNVSHANNYYGHNLMELQDGEVFILDNNGTMTPIEKASQQFSQPYASGVYRVGTDIPAGTYKLSVGDGANDYSACYVMSDLNFTSSSYLYSNYFVPGDTPGEITLEEGTYIELYNMQMTPFTL